MSSLPTTALYSCFVPCNLQFTDAQQYEDHSLSQDKSRTYARLECNLCGWHVSSELVSNKVKKHIFDIKHTCNVAKLMSPLVK